MATAKDIILRPIKRAEADAVIKEHHYSGKVVNNSQLHIGVFIDGELHGAMQFGPSLDKRKVGGLVRDTPWNGFIELNRMAFGPALPRNSESRALAIAMKLIRKHAPHIEWVVSFSDGAQCGDGTIYRAAGFWLTQIKRNDQMWQAPEGDACKARISLTDGKSHGEQDRARAIVNRVSVMKGTHTGAASGGASMKPYIEAGFTPIPGFQLRYIYPLRDDIEARLTCPILPYSAIDDAGARMYKGQALAHREASVPTEERRCDPDPNAFANPTADDKP